jgi:threonine/homoserine/homoserine lactone efflux protein
MELFFFLITAVGISLSGAMSPGPMTAAAIAMGTSSRFAGALLAVGHAIIEFPLMILIALGLGKILGSTYVKIFIGLTGGVFLLFMAIKMFRGSKSEAVQNVKAAKSGPIAAGIVLSGGNPYFLLWWATVGLALATTATGLGIWAFALFVIVHWLCDLIWLSALSWASFKGMGLFGPHSQQIVLWFCSVVLIGFGAFFIYNATNTLIKLL